MARKSKEAEQEYQHKYYEEHIKNNDEAREKKNARQREYAKRTSYASSTKYEKNNVKRYVIKFVIESEHNMIDWLETQDNKTTYIKNLIKKDMENSKII